MEKKNHYKIVKIIKEEINSFLTELNLYHASNSDFNRFNHKKYLSSGAGSQVFGWGTYLTDSFPIAKDYAEKFINYKFNQFVMAADPSDYIDFSQYEQDVPQKVLSYYRRVVSLGMLNHIAGKWTNHSFDDFATITNENPGAEYDKIVQDYEDQKKIMMNFCNEVGLTFDENDYKKNMTLYRDAVLYSREEYIKKIEKENLVKKLFKQAVDRIWDAGLKNTLQHSYIYEVSIPDDNGSNYIHYDEYVSDDIIKRITNGFSLLSKRFNKPYINRWNDFLEEVASMTNRMFGKSILYGIEKVFNDVKDMEKAKSLFLLQCGFIGIKYKAGTIWELPDEADENSMNYVIFNSNDIKITSKNIFRT